MSFEYLIVGIAKDEQQDYREFYDKTKVETYMFALSLVKDRVLARDIAVEAYKRVYSLAYKFDTDLNAEYWILDIVKNLCINSLKHEELRKVADSNRIDNLTRLLSDLILQTAEDRAKFIVLRTVSGLNKSEIAKLLWYQGGSASAEYRRGIKELVALDPAERSNDSVKENLTEDMKSCTPDMWGLVIKDEATRVSFVSHEELEIDDDEIAFSEDKEELKKIKRAADRKRRKIKILTVVIAIILLCGVIAGVIAAVVAYNKEQNTVSKLPQSNTIDITMPQFRTKMAMAELDGVLYYSNYNDEGKLYKADFSSGNSVVSKISDDIPKEIVAYNSDSKYIIYRNYTDGKIYRYSPSDGQTVRLCEISGAALCLKDDKLYFSTSTGISSISVSGDMSSYKEVFIVSDLSNPFRYDIEVNASENVYFSSGAEAGLFILKEYKDESTGEVGIYNEGIYAGNIYDMHLYGDSIYFDISENNTSVLCKLDISNEYKVSRIENVFLSSAAICISDGYIYYAGYEEDPTVNENAQRGLFRMSVDLGAPEMLVAQTDATLFISDLYISDSKIYCYSCTAAAEGIKKLVAYDKEGLNKDNFTEKDSEIF
ncbi:MAG: DUF5050 domain-containing protein [Clostridia bacterium]|nr:DUF5050 domain-containing protein [Clostridia bacterium]